jgi:hypothetical protein
LELASPEVQQSLVGTDLAIADVEGLIIDKKTDQLGVGDIDHRFPGLGVAVGGLGIRQWTALIDAVQVRTGKTVGFALIQVAPPADVAV